MADHPTDEDRRPDGGSPEPGTPPAEQSWKGLAVGLAVSIALVLLVVAVVVASRGGSDDATGPPPTAAGATASTQGTQPVTTPGQPSETGGPPTTRKPTPRPIIAADDRRIVVLDQSGSAAPRTLFDLGPSQPSDEVPPSIGGVSLGGDGSAAYFDVIGSPLAGAMKQVSVSGSQSQDIGPGVAPVPSPDGSLLAFIEAPEPDVSATLVVRALAGGNERRIDLGDGTCGNISWAPSVRELAVDICSGGEPSTVAVVDVASGGVRPLAPPDGPTWSVPAFKPDGTLTLVEQRGTDAVVVALTPERSAVAATVLRRPSTTINTIDWSAAGDLVLCDADGIVVAVIGGAQAQQVATGFSAAVW